MLRVLCIRVLGHQIAYSTLKSWPEEGDCEGVSKAYKALTFCLRKLMKRLKAGLGAWKVGRIQAVVLIAPF